MLISAYEGIQSFHRSAGIAELNFSKERETAVWMRAFAMDFDVSASIQISSRQSAKRWSVPQEWIWSIMRTRVYTNRCGFTGRREGLMQFMPLTARNLYKLSGENVPDGFDLLNPDINIRLGGQYLARLMLKFNGQLALVAAAYNSGPHRVESWLVSFRPFGYRRIC